MRSIRFCALMSAAGALLMAQHGYTPGGCRGRRTAVHRKLRDLPWSGRRRGAGRELARGKFRHASSDEELGQIIKNGIPGTAMPPGNFHEHQMTALIAYLRSMSACGARNRCPGKRRSRKGHFRRQRQCLNCHRVDGKGSYLGPELTDIGVRRRAAQLERSILDPDAEILPQNRFFRVVTKDGTTVVGRLLNLDTFTVQMMDSHEQLRSFAKTNLKEYGFIDKSPMPSYKDKLSSAGTGGPCHLSGHSERSRQDNESPRSCCCCSPPVLFRRR